MLKPGQTLKDLVDYRTPYYEKYADLIVDEENLDIRGVVERIVSALESVESVSYTHLIITLLVRDKSISLLVVEPLYCTFVHCGTSLK